MNVESVGPSEYGESGSQWIWRVGSSKYGEQVLVNMKNVGPGEHGECEFW